MWTRCFIGKRALYYHTWSKEGSTHNYEIDFILAEKGKIIPVEVKSAGIKKHESADVFIPKYHNRILKPYLFSQHLRSDDRGLENLPFYFVPFLAC